MDELISRQAAIDAVISLCDECDSGYCGPCRVNYPGEKDAKKALKELPSAQQEPRWIPCEVRLPAVNEHVLCQLNDAYYDPICIMALIVDYAGGESFVYWKDRDDGTEYDVEDVVAWQYLPKPYERSEE